MSNSSVAASASPDRLSDTLGPMPEWDLSDLYDSPQSSRLVADLKAAEAGAKRFHERYQGQLATLSGDAMAEAVAEYERLGEILGRVMSYAQLRYAANISDSERGRFQQGMQERVTDISTKTLFFTLELNRLDDAVLAAKLASVKLARYAPWIRDVRVFRDHQLSDDMEQLLHEKEVAGHASWTRLFEETMAELRFPVDGAKLTSAETLHLMSDTAPETRKAAAKAFGTVLGENVRVFSLITNTLIKEKEIEDKWRRYPRADSSRNLSNQVEDGVVDALVAAVKGSYGRLSHRYYALKAKWFSVDALDYWDRNAPLPDDDDRQFTWAQAKDVVLGAYGAFSPDMAKVGARFFEGGWIDAPARPGKSPGAFAHPTVPSVHPYLLLNYLGKTRDVMTLAHELGHGVHQVLAGVQGGLLADTPLTLAETASVFGEMLTFRALLEQETTVARRRIMLASKVEDMLNTVVRQIAFYDFEQRIHQARRDGELAQEQIGDIWMEVQRQSLGPALRFDDEYRFYWSYIPHFIHSPFYVYAYAFGDCLVNSLYDVYLSGAAGFQQKYLDMLTAGGTLRHKELLAPFGLDASDPSFWQRGLNVVAGFIDELEGLS
ncbi:M3 family oligoendopeptidase [Telmatospirillum sp.]|uniref:M3 family oligoendopeptidase n=1 Tax=Telmatospirillum sp. TaxID=2079197 RepID=UPI002840BE9B|nr:M3 family oligoendopeptidase [Telmatospirillum sp.]MDR3439234.1 M3 family oligoendopeptidase [Telmatospirillum sp.]